MRNLPASPMKRVLLVAASFLIALTLALASTAIRPSAQERGGQQATLGDIQAAEAILGQPVPQVRARFRDLTQSGIGIDPIGPDESTRGVHISYGIQGRNVVLLTIRRGSIMAEGEMKQLPAATATVMLKDLADGTRDVRYAWNQGGLGIVLHVNLSSLITRADADLIAASVR